MVRAHGDFVMGGGGGSGLYFWGDRGVLQCVYQKIFNK